MLLKKLTRCAAILALAFYFLQMGSNISAQNVCKKGMVCIAGAEPVPDIGPLPPTVRTGPGKLQQLGELLFCDHRLSADDAYACAQCHNPNHGFADSVPVSSVVLGQEPGMKRNTPTLYNVGYNIDLHVDHGTGLPSPVLMWDGRTPAGLMPLQKPFDDILVEQMLLPVKGQEMHVTYDNIIKKFSGKLKSYDYTNFPQADRDLYKNKFKDVFGSETIVPEEIYVAIAAFERTIISSDSPFDDYIKTGKFSAQFREAHEMAGIDLFKGKARCILCHYGPNFTDNKFHNVGWPADLIDEHWKYRAPQPGQVIDDGRYSGLQRRGKRPAEKDRGAFKTPTLRGISETTPYMHDGGLPSNFTILPEVDKVPTSLKTAVKFFASGGGEGVPIPDPLMKSVSLTPVEEGHLVEFLMSLKGKPIQLHNMCPWPARAG